MCDTGPIEYTDGRNDKNKPKTPSQEALDAIQAQIAQSQSANYNSGGQSQAQAAMAAKRQQLAMLNYGLASTFSPTLGGAPAASTRPAGRAQTLISDGPQQVNNNDPVKTGYSKY